MAFTVPWSLIALGVSGDVGDLTIYTDRFSRKVAFPKSPPDKPPSPLQTTQRARFVTAQKAWSDLTDAEKRQLETAVKRASVVMTGQNLYISVALRNDADALDTLARQTNTNLPAIPFIA